MPSPDLRPYVDPTVYDVDPEQLVARALEVAEDRFPDWEPAAANLEVELLEVLAVATSEIVFALNRIPATVVSAVIGLLGVQPDEGSYAHVDVGFRVIDGAGHTIPSGTRVRLELDGGANWLDFTTDADLVIESPLTVGAVPASALTRGALANGLNSDGANVTHMLVLDALPFVMEAGLAGMVAGGADPESSTEWRARAVARLERLTDSLVLPRHFAARALEEPGVQRARAIDLYDPAVGVAGASMGHITVVAGGPGGAPLDGPDAAALLVELQEHAVGGLIVHLVPPALFTVDVTATVIRKADAVDADVVAAIEATLAAYLSADQWPWGQLVRPQELLVAIDGAAGVDVVLSVTDPFAALFPGPTGLPVLGAVAITVVAP